MTPAEIGANINNLKHRLKCISCNNAETQEQINDILIRLEILETNGGNIDVSELLQRVEDLENEVSSIEGRVDTIENTLPLKADLVGGTVPPSQLPNSIIPLYVTNYDALPPPNTVTGKTYGVLNSQGTAWLPGYIGGTYYSKGYYYSDGSQWIFMGSFPHQASQSNVDAGIITDQFVSPNTFENASKWNTKENTITPGTTSQYWRGDKTWQNFPTASAINGWAINGNTVNTNDWFGTLNNQDIIFRRNNVVIARFGASNRLSIGTNAGNGSNSNFLGQSAGFGTTSVNNSNFLGQSAGQNATGASNSNFLGNGAGQSATNATSSNFLGLRAGGGATNAQDSNFFGTDAGRTAPNANQSNFFGLSAGWEALNANNSNFLGKDAGFNATHANNSNFFGQLAGFEATNANNSNFFGWEAGRGATDASFSNLFGRNAGRTFSGNNIGPNNIIIGTNISLPDAATNRINIGGVIFGNGTHSVAFNLPSIVPATNPQVGIGIVTPHASSILDLTSTSRGFLPPRMTTTQRDAIISPAEGLVIYNTDWKVLNTFNGTFWEEERRVVKATATSRTAVVATDDPELQIPITVGIWYISGHFQTETGTNNVRTRFRFPLVVNSTQRPIQILNVSGVFSYSILVGRTETNQQTTTSGPIGTFFGTIEVLESGILSLQWAQISLDTDNPTTIVAGSHITAKRIR